MAAHSGITGPGASEVLGVIYVARKILEALAPGMAQQRLEGWSRGPATSVLFLLCCLGSWLACHTLPVHSPQPSEVQKVVEELQLLSKILLKDVEEEKRVPVSQNYTLPCFIPDAQPPNNIHSLAIRAYLKVISQVDSKSVIDEIIEQLDKLIFRDVPETNISVPTDTFERKRFILTIFQQFSECMDLALKSLTSGAQQATT
ncbi:interleukin-31 [Aotus nancymaae]|uniref:interleukin-31 n=1 Tax=Aotus nancymaae TaxID=37293 RepID=UPI0030FE9013